MCFPRMMLLQVIIMVVGVMLTSEMAASVAVVAAAPIAKPNCLDRCGDVEIPFPFGTSKGCYHDQYYFVNCTNDSSGKTRRPIYGNVDVLSISLELGQLEFSGFPAYECYNKSGTRMNETYYFLTSFGSISYTQNVFVAVGCNTYSYLYATKNNRTFSMGCMSVCRDANDVANESCSGIGCCQLEIPKGLRNFSFEANTFDEVNVSTFNPCSYAFIVKKSAFNFSTKYLRGQYLRKRKFPMVLDWGIRNETCARPKSDILCGGNSRCYDTDNGFGYRCTCNPGYDGNPYLSNGCQDINECHDPRYHNNCTQPERCKNTIGNYTCSCPKWKRGDGRKDGTGCDVNLPVLLIWMVVGIGITILMLLVGSFLVYWGLKKRNLIKLREKFFQQNGGLVLQQRVSNHQGSMEPVRIFSAKELDKATNNYNKSRILGQGGYGTVYRGVLIDNKVVAIKRSKIADQNQIDQFINEMIVLTQINHRNVVKLLGCCLESEVPLLVYEFITSGTLSNHIHDKKKSSLLLWEKRLKIATEAAGALAYLHFEASIPIIHRDVKTANILLDDNHTAKVADFGASRLIPLDHTRLTTLVQGTFGYLDPEYVRSGQLTEKSDVYSFGVVLAELLTGEKAISLDRAESERNLATYFVSALKDDRLLEIIEGHIINEGNVEEIKEVSYIAKRCLSIKGEDRPTMKDVAMELEGLRIKENPSHEKADLYREETECCSLDATTSYLSLDTGTANSSTSTTIDRMGDQVSKSTIVCR